MTTIHVAGPRELLAYVPYRLRYQPTESVVLVSLRDGGSRVGILARADIPELADIVQGPRTAHALAAHLRADGACRAVMVVYTNAPLRAHTAAAARERAAAEHCRQAVEEIIGPCAAWHVSARGYGELDCTDVSCCPPGGRDVVELSDTVVSAHMVYQGVLVARGREEYTRIDLAPALRRVRSRRAMEDALARWQVACQDDDLPRLRQWQEQGAQVWLAVWGEMSADASEPDPELLGRLGAALNSVDVRDAVLVSVVMGDCDSAVPVAQGRGAAKIASMMAAVIDPEGALPAASGSLDSALRVLIAVAAHVGGAPVHAVLAFLAWWAGDGASAAARVADALGQDPHYRLAQLVDAALRAGVPPGWASSSV